MDVRTNSPITEPKHCKGFINAKKLCTTCTCNPNGRAPELVYERMNGNNICYCKGADGNTISEVCHGPLPNGNVAPSNIAPRTETNHLMATMFGNKNMYIIKNIYQWKANLQYNVKASIEYFNR